MTSFLDHGDRRFQVLAYHDAIRHDGPALELAELVDGEVGPELMTVLFSASGAEETEVLLYESSLPLPIVTAFLEAAKERTSQITRRIR
ncbi:hypothetical protein [Paractinoplanes atraurantiacus]|uniref:Uncharacterized protein n=1 Tax=Paractinoplanes atraurantiacus TaxID=1036182 RepID=A0A285HNW9_9ACTN|nr:hypothetical protein [Actinoplanes atraurantiacus]SNY37293.1 hypothetical protein SAMN05421748_10571 [Actinoplanes atraurantiacus]